MMDEQQRQRGGGGGRWHDTLDSLVSEAGDVLGSALRRPDHYVTVAAPSVSPVTVAVAAAAAMALGVMVASSRRR